LQTVTGYGTQSDWLCAFGTKGLWQPEASQSPLFTTGIWKRRMIGFSFTVIIRSKMNTHVTIFLFELSDVSTNVLPENTNHEVDTRKYPPGSLSPRMPPRIQLSDPCNSKLRASPSPCHSHKRHPVSVTTLFTSKSIHLRVLQPPLLRHPRDTEYHS
jgi:hypothetical protein